SGETYFSSQVSSAAPLATAPVAAPPPAVASVLPAWADRRCAGVSSSRPIVCNRGCVIRVAVNLFAVLACSTEHLSKRSYISTPRLQTSVSEPWHLVQLPSRTCALPEHMARLNDPARAVKPLIGREAHTPPSRSDETLGG